MQKKVRGRRGQVHFAHAMRLSLRRACALLEVARSKIHDRDTKFSAAFNTMFPAEEVSIIRTPVQAPNANAFAERWTRSVREECFDQILILGERHLYRVLAA